MSPRKRKEPKDGWASLTVDELQDQLEARGLKKSGKKDELVARLEDFEAKLEQATAGGEPEEAEQPEQAADQLDEAEGDDEAEDDEVETEPARRPRGSAETTTAIERKPAPLSEDGRVIVRARARYVRGAPRKARIVMNHIRGKQVGQARALLAHTPRAVSIDIIKLLDSAVANAESNYELAGDELRVARAYVDEGPTIKRYRPRAYGRATRINKRTSHMTIELTTIDGGS